MTGSDPANSPGSEGYAFVFHPGEAEKGFVVFVRDDGVVTTARQVTATVDHRYDTYTPGNPPSSATVAIINTTVPMVAPPPPDPPPPADFELPTDLQPQVEALGDRARDPAKAQTIMMGTFVDAGGTSWPRAEVKQQTTGHLRVENVKANNAPIFFDGEAVRSNGVRAARTLSHADEGIVESFALDSVLGLLTSADHGAAASLLGQGFRPDSSVAPNYTGPSYDIFEMVGQVDVGGTVSDLGKRYYFDSATGLLLRTTYTDGVRVETRFSNWTAVDGSMYPSRIERYENGAQMFKFDATMIVAAPAVPGDEFTGP